MSERRAPHGQMEHPGGQVVCDAVGVKHDGTCAIGPSTTQQIWPAVQQLEPQQLVPVPHAVPALQGAAMHVP